MGAGRSAKMVLIHVKKGEDVNFYVEHDVAEDIDDVSRNVITIFNTVLQARRLKSACDDLVQYGPMKPPETQSVMEDEEGSPADIEAMCKANPHFDPTGKRTGDAPSENMADVIRRTVAELEASISKEQFEKKVVFNLEMFQEKFDNVRGALMIVYPMGLPDWEPARLIFEDEEDLSGSQASLDVQDPETSVMWWASKQLSRKGKELQRDRHNSNPKKTKRP